MKQYDIIIIGAGASGLMAAVAALKRGKQVLILEMSDAPARKVMISGGGNCNITNAAANWDRYFGNNPKFTRSALAQYTPNDVLSWAQKHKLNPFEKTPGRYFCASGADAVVQALAHDTKNAKIIYKTTVKQVTKQNNSFSVITDKDTFFATSVIVATGGISFDSVAVSDIGYKIAKDFGHKIVPVRPALCAIATKNIPNIMAGISVPVQISVGKNIVNDELLFTHFGIGGPAAYRTSLYDLSSGFYINFLPNTDIQSVIYNARQISGKKSLANVIAQYLPTKVAKWAVGDINKNIADLTKSEIQNVASKIHKFFIPKDDIKLHNMKSAEVVRGGVATDDISSKTMESGLCRNLFFVGEVLDITGDLGGFNLQWAWASGTVAGQHA